MQIIFFSPNGQPNGPRRRVINYAERLVRSGNDVTIIVKRFSHSSTIKEVKREFKLANIEKISMSRSISNYRKFVLNDQDSLDLQSGCPIHVRAGSFHNYLLNQNPKLKGRYQLIQGGDKVKWYHCDDPFQTVFAYKVGEYPAEIAPKMNFEMQFQKTVLDPLNRIIVPAGLPALNPSLAYTVSLF